MFYYAKHMEGLMFTLIRKKVDCHKYISMNGQIVY